MFIGTSEPGVLVSFVGADVLGGPACPTGETRVYPRRSFAETVLSSPASLSPHFAVLILLPLCFFTRSVARPMNGFPCGT